MKRYCLVIFALSSCAWAGKIAVRLSPIVPPQCAAFVTNVEADGLTMSGKIIPFAKLTRVDLAPMQLSQVAMGVKPLGSATLRTVQVKLSQAMCATRTGKRYLSYSPQSVLARAHYNAAAKLATIVLILDLRTVSKNGIRPVMKQLKIAGHLDEPPSPESLNGLVIGSNKKAVMIITQ